MILFFYGPDSYRRRQKIKEIINDKKKRYPNIHLDYFDFANKESKHNELIRLKEFVSGASLFSDKKLAILEGFFSDIGDYSEKQRKEIKKFLQRLMSPQDVILIISEEKKPPVGFDFLTDEKASPSELKFQEFENLSGDKLRYFIRKEAKDNGFNLTPAAIDFLARNFSSDSWGLVNELKKLSLIKSEIIDVVQIREISDYIQPLVDGQQIYYSIMDIAANRPFSQRLGSLEILFYRQEEPAKIFNILASQIKDLETAKKIADYDALIKFGRMDYEEALLDLVIN